MFNPEVEKKILDFIKKSPIGVTSSEIAKYLNINRMTMAKYLAVIRERALIDFKQLGMAKLWFIPVEINREWFLNNILVEIIAKSNNLSLVDKSAAKVGERIAELYRAFYGVSSLNIEQISDSIEDFGSKIGGEFKIVEKDKDKITIKIARCPFGDNVKLCPDLCNISINLLGAFPSTLITALLLNV